MTSHLSLLTGLYHREDTSNILTDNPIWSDLVYGSEHVRPEVAVIVCSLSLACDGERLAIMNNDSVCCIGFVSLDSDVEYCSSFIFMFYVFYKTPYKSILVVAVSFIWTDSYTIYRMFIYLSAFDYANAFRDPFRYGNGTVEYISCYLGYPGCKLFTDGCRSHGSVFFFMAIHREITFIQCLFPFIFQIEALTGEFFPDGITSESFQEGTQFPVTNDKSESGPIL